MGSIFDYAYIPFNRKSVKDINLWFDHIDPRLSRGIMYNQGLMYYVPKRWGKRVKSEETSEVEETPEVEVSPYLEKALDLTGFLKETHTIIRRLKLGSIAYNLIENTLFSYVFEDIITTAELYSNLHFKFYEHCYKLVVVPHEIGQSFDLELHSTVHCGLEDPNHINLKKLQPLFVEINKQFEIMTNQLLYFSGNTPEHLGMALTILNEYPVSRVGVTTCFKLLNSEELTSAYGITTDVHKMQHIISQLNDSIPDHIKHITNGSMFRAGISSLAKSEIGSIFIQNVGQAVLKELKNIVFFEFI